MFVFYVLFVQKYYKSSTVQYYSRSLVGCARVPSRVWLSVTPWTVVHQAPLSVNIPGKDTAVGCHFLLLDLWTDWTQEHALGMELLAV